MEDKEILKLKNKIPGEFFQTPIQILTSTTKEKLKFLDCNFIIPDNNSFMLRDYRGLAMLMGYNTMDYNHLIDQKKYTSPTYLILERMKMEKKTVGDLILYLLQLKRIDILSNIREFCYNDVYYYLTKTNDGQNKTINYEDLSRLASTAEIDEAKKTLNTLFTTDIIETTNKQIDVYDIFISFDSEAISDIKIMWELSSRLEESGLTVAKGSYSFFQGCCLIEAFAHAIYNRSKKVILVISQSYINSESCLMQLYFAKDADKAALRNKVIPFYIENVKKPECIANINSFRYFDEFYRDNFYDDFVRNMKTI